ncbi:MAG: hypothetical protein LQ340_004404 [Diploschistes diacapsis]|nr:MAG: hypothetical protein LQ340_004404 [Diploschistes diacapsis]
MVRAGLVVKSPTVAPQWWLLDRCHPTPGQSAQSILPVTNYFDEGHDFQEDWDFDLDSSYGEHDPADFTSSLSPDATLIYAFSALHSSFAFSQLTCRLQLRSNRAANRVNRGQAEHDIMDGLPVRQWRKQPTLVNLAPQKEVQPDMTDSDSKWRELPMPKGSEMYPPWSQALLRAARAGRIIQQPQKPADDNKEASEDEDADGELDTGFLVTRWAQLPREIEQPEPEYLAKRRKGLPTLYGGMNGNLTALTTLRKTKVRKIDNDGNVVFLDVLVPEGVLIEGEVADSNDVSTQAPAPGTVVEGIGVVNAEGIVVMAEQAAPTPARRRPPPPKRKPKGPGRGRKKKVVVENGTDGLPLAVNANNGRVGSASSTVGKAGVSGVADMETANDNGAGDESLLQEGEEGSEEDDEDGEEGDDAEREEGELSDTEEPLSRSATPSKRLTKPTIDASVPVSGPAGNVAAKTNYLVPPTISIQPSVELPASTVTATTATVSDILQPMPGLPTLPNISQAAENGTPTEDATAMSSSAAPRGLDELSKASRQIDESLSSKVESPAPATAPQAPLVVDPSARHSEASAVGSSQLNAAEQTLAVTDREQTKAIGLDSAPSPPILDGNLAQAPPMPQSDVPTVVEAPSFIPEAPLPATVPEAHNPLEVLCEPQAAEQPSKESADTSISTSGDGNKNEKTVEVDVPVASDTTAPATNSDAASQVPEQPSGAEDDIFGSLERHLQSKSG